MIVPIEPINQISEIQINSWNMCKIMIELKW